MIKSLVPWQILPGPPLELKGNAKEMNFLTQNNFPPLIVATDTKTSENCLWQ